MVGKSGRASARLSLLLMALMVLQSVTLLASPTPLDDIKTPQFTGGDDTTWYDGGIVWPQLGRYGSRNASAPDHSTNGGPGSGSVANVTTLATIEEPEVNWHHFSTNDYGAVGLASVVADFSGNIEVTGNAAERCGQDRLFTVMVSERDSGGSVHSFLSIVDGGSSKKAWEADLGATDEVMAAPVIVDADADGTLEILVAYDAQGTFNTELWGPELSCSEAGWTYGGTDTNDPLWSYSDPDLGITVPSPYILANHQVGSQILLADLDLDGDAEAVFSLVKEADDQVVVLALPVVGGGTPTPLWQTSLDDGEIPSDPAWVKIDDTNSAVVLTTINPDDGNVWVWRLDGNNGASQWNGVSLGTPEGNTDSPHIRLPGPVIAELDGTTGDEMILTIPTDVDGSGAADGAEFIGMEINDASVLWSFEASNGFADAPPDPVDTDGDGIDDRVCWVTWYRIDTDRKGVAGCHDVSGVAGPVEEFSHTLDRSSGNPNDEIAVSPPFHLDLDGQGAPELVVAFGRSLWAWDGDSGTQAGISLGWANEMDLPHRAWAAPALADIDGDGAIDILIGDTLVSRAAPDVRPFADGRGIQFTPSQPDPDESFTITAYVENVGTINTGEAVDAVLYWDGVEVHRERMAAMDPVEPSPADGNWATFSIEMDAPLGNHIARIVIDPYNNITQARYDNDEQIVELTIVEPYAVSISMPADPVRVDPGGQEDVALSVSSTGRLTGIWSMSIDSLGLPNNWTIQDITSGGSNSVTIADEQPWTAQFRITAPPEALGSDNGFATVTMTLDDDANVSYSAILPIEANRTRGLSVRGPDGTATSIGHGIPNGFANSWILVENLGNAQETATEIAWNPTSWSNNLTLHDSNGVVNVLTLGPGEKRELHAKLPVPAGTTLGDSVSSTLTICIGTGVEEVCRDVELAFVANGVSIHPDNQRTEPTTGLSWAINAELPAGADNLSWDLQNSGMMNNGWVWGATGDFVLSGNTLTAAGALGSALSGTLTLDLPVDAPPQYHPFDAEENNNSDLGVHFSLQVLQVFRSSVAIVAPTEVPAQFNVTEPDWVVLRLENPGNGPDVYDLTARLLPNDNFSEDPGIIFAIPSPTYSISAAGLRQVPIELTLPADTPARKGMLIEFQLHSHGDDSVYSVAILEVEARQDHRWEVTLNDGGVIKDSGAGVFVSPGSSDDFSFVVQNIGNFDDALDFTSSFTVNSAGNDSSTGWQVGNGSSGNLAVNQTTTIEIPFTSPELAWNGTIVSLSLLLSADGIVVETFLLELEVIHQPLWLVSATGSDLDVESDGSNISLLLLQRGNLPSQPFISGAIDGFGWNLTMPSDLPSLEPGQSLQFEVFVTPPDGALSGPTVELTIRSRNGDGSGLGEMILPVRVQPSYGFTADSPDEPWEEWLVSMEGGMVRIPIQNSGNAPNIIDVEILGLPTGWGPATAEVNLAWNEWRGLPIDLQPAADWDRSTFPVQLRLTDAGGNFRVVDVSVVYSDYTWASSPVMWGSLGDDKLISFHGGNINSGVATSGDLRSYGLNWLLPAPDGDGSIALATPNGTVTLWYSAQMQAATTTRSIACSFDSNSSVEPLVSCTIGNSTTPFEWTAILRTSDGSIIEQLTGTAPGGQQATVNLSGLSWQRTAGIHTMTVLFYSSDGALASSTSQNYVIRATGWNIGILLEEANDGKLNVLINRENQQILVNPHCKVELSQGSWAKTLEIDVMASIAPKLSVERPAGPAELPVTALLSCEVPWDIDDDVEDNNATLILKAETSLIPVDRDVLYGVGAAALIIGVLYLLGLLRPASGGSRPLSAGRAKRGLGTRGSAGQGSGTSRSAGSRRDQKLAAASETEDIAPDYESEMHLEGADSAGGSETEADRLEEEAVVEDLTDMQESLVEVEESIVDDEPPEEELDEFERRLRDLRNRRQNKE